MNHKINEVVITTTHHSSHNTSKMPLSFLETPQSYDVITQHTFETQVSTNIHDILKNATGLQRSWESTGLGIQGGEYYTLRGFALQPNLLNGLPSYTNATLDIANIEQIEVVKGPNGTLYGGNAVSYGGLINVITKKPHDTFNANVNYITGSNNLNRFAIDVNSPLSSKISFRINAAYHKENSFQDAGFKESIFVAPSVKFSLLENLKLFVDFQYKAAESAHAPMYFLSRNEMMSFDRIDLFKDNYKNSYTINDLSIKNPTLTSQVRLEYQIAQNWTSNTLISINNTRSRGYDQLFSDLNNGDEFLRFLSKVNSKTDVISLQHNLTGKFRIGNFNNTILFGLDYLSKKFDSYDGDLIDYGIISLKHQSDTAEMNKSEIDQALADINTTHNVAKTQTYGAYISNVTAFSPNLSLMLSLRIDHLKGNSSSFGKQSNYQTTLSPKFGLVYQPIKDKWAFFANYLNGFLYLDPAVTSNDDGTTKSIKPFDPEQANQFEIGTKVKLFDGKLDASISYYDITVTNKLMSDLNTLDGLKQGGKVKSKGLELSVSGQLVPGWDFISGFSHNYNKVTRSIAEDDGILGRRPEEAGPANSFHLWTNYKLQTGVLKNLSLGFGVYSTSSFNTLNRSTIGVFTLPSYTVLNTAIGYDINNLSFIFKIDNLTNRKYFTGSGTVNPQKSRSLSLSLSYSL
ncbi:TonB-dependent siderophore receptor [Myroides albus]|uniref:TonB-dependent siderophore receptor n=1 Tax=Myroides albus TaxID=2562892 RepID=UPI00293920C0|nr:TonB-dependent siderophore receptor [Myroides albus]